MRWLVALRQRIAQVCGDVDVQLRQRHDLVPNLVETVRGYAAHERGTLDAVVQARNAAAAARDPGQVVQSEAALQASLGRRVALGEGSPRRQGPWPRSMPGRCGRCSSASC